MFTFLLASATVAYTVSPVSRVVDLLRHLKGGIEADGKTEQQVYDKFACWCEETTARKASDIENANSRIEELTTLIEQNSGRKGTFEAEINQLKKDIAANQKSQAEATGMRKKQNQAYSKERFETEQCIGALEHATKVLDGAGSGKKTSTLQEAETLSVVKGVSKALSQLPDENSLSSEDRNVVSSFVNQAHGEGFLQVGNNPFGDYAPASTQIQGILKNMYDTFVAQMERSNGDEANQNKAYKELIQTKQEELETLKESLTQKVAAQAENGESLAESKLERANLKKQVAADKAFFQETKKNCKDQADAWAERSRLRTEELGGINKAVGILSSNEELFGRSSSFIQLPSNKAVALLSRVARMHHSLRLAALAVKAKTFGGHFDDVIKMIDEMIGVIRKEDQDDINAKDTCDMEFAALTSESGDLAHFAEKTANLIEALKKQAANIGKRLEETQQEIRSNKDEMQTAFEERSDQKRQFEKSLQDDKDAARLIGQAVETLGAFYTNNKIPLGLLKQPGETYTMDQDKAPDTFKKPYKGRSSESGGIVAILSMLKEDVESEIEESIHNEAQTQKDYEDTKKASLENLATLKQTRASLKKQLATNAELSASAETDRNNLDNLDGANRGQFESHCTGCAWIYTNLSPAFGRLSEKCPSLAVSDVSSFETRKSRRKDELQGLQDARSSLAGAE